MANRISDQEKDHICFHEWMVQQEEDLSELLQAHKAAVNPNGTSHNLRELIEKNIQHYQAYSERRIRLAREDVSSFFSPTWCSSLESSMLWLAGCRPSIFIRLVYAICGLQIESQLAQFLEGTRTDTLELLSPRQLSSINDLQTRTNNEEERLSNLMASLQEKMGDQRLVAIVNESSLGSSKPNRKADEALDEHELSMVCILEAADRLRLKTLKEVLNILNPVQGVNFLAASKKIHLCVHEWGKKRDRVHGRKRT